jgi:hypothetical protein
LERGGLKLPADKALPYAATTNIFPYYFVADEAFPLKPYLMHNFVRKSEGSVYEPQLLVEYTDITDMVDLYVDEQGTLLAGPTAGVLRGHLANYFLKPEASLPWQWKYCL